MRDIDLWMHRVVSGQHLLARALGLSRTWQGALAELSRFSSLSGRAIALAETRD
jgi:hypothetical protein